MIDETTQRAALQERFLLNLKDIMDDWLNNSRAKTDKDKLGGAIFLILALIDGMGGGAGVYPLLALADDEIEVIEIQGDLHDNWARMWNT